MNLNKAQNPAPQRGAVLIVVLWMTALIALLVGVLASEVRLSAKAVHYHKQGVQQWADMLAALRMAEMELMVQRMPQPPREAKPSQEPQDSPLFQFDGRPLTLSYPAPSNITVRIIDHAGLINLKSIDSGRFHQLLEHHLGKGNPQIDELYDAWLDWQDADDLTRLNGAEKDFYEKQKPPYTPRNGEVETVEELLLIKGFSQLLKETNLHATFTLLGNSGGGVNPNYATVETLAMLPGMTVETARKILLKRTETVFKSTQDITSILSPEQLTKVTPWLQFTIATANYYTIYLEPKREDNQPPYAFMAIVQLQGYTTPPKILYARPYMALPDRVFEQEALKATEKTKKQDKQDKHENPA